MDYSSRERSTSIRRKRSKKNNDLPSEKSTTSEIADIKLPDSIKTAQVTHLTDSRKRKQSDTHTLFPASEVQHDSNNEHTKGSISAKGKSRPTSSKHSVLGHEKIVAGNMAQTSFHKPISAANGRAASVRHETISDTEFDDGASVADSVISTTRMRRTEAERLEYFKNEPECGVLEKNRVECTRCRKFISLGRRTKYKIRPWELHRASCDKRMPKTVLLDTTAIENGDDDEKMTKTSHKTVERRESSGSEPVVEPREVSRLSGDGSQHSKSLQETNATPGRLTTAAARTLKFVNDAQIEFFNAKQIICAFCNTTINLNGEEGSNDVDWEEHKMTCTHPLDTKSGSQRIERNADAELDRQSVLNPSQQPPPSTPSTQNALFASELRYPRGKKRFRDQVDVDARSDTRPSNRPRTDKYTALDREVSNTAGWLILPFKAFILGFKESLKRL